MIKAAKHHIQKLDFLRGIAILMVFIFHCQLALYPNYAVNAYKPNGMIDISSTKSFLLNFSPSAFGWTGVELFFVISGFLIHLGYLRTGSELNLKTFFSKRFWRIFPPYWLVLIVLCIMAFAFHHSFSKTKMLDYVVHFFTLQNFSAKTYYSINGSFWSLAFEVQMYLIYPLFLLLRKYWGIKVAFLTTLLLPVLFSPLIFMFVKSGNELAFPGSVFVIWFTWTAGAYYAESYFNGRRIFKKVGLAIFLFTFLLLIASKYCKYSNAISLHLATLAWVLFLDWILYTKSVKMDHLLVRGIVFFGLCSYSFYLIHQPYLTDLINVFRISPGQGLLTASLSIFVAFIILLLISYLLYRLVELPSIAFGYKLRSKNKSNSSSIIEKS